MGLPVLLLDTRLETRGHREFFKRLAAGSPDVLLAVSPGVAESFPEPAEDLDQDAGPSLIEHLRRFLFSPNPLPCATRDGFEMFSAPGEGLETAEIARRILKLAREGIAFDQVAILLRNPDRYQAAVEDSLRRADVPAYFSQGTARPDPAGRAFLVLLRCAAENLSASSFAEYLSLGQVPAVEAPRQMGCSGRRNSFARCAGGSRAASSGADSEHSRGLGETAGGCGRDRRSRPLGPAR